MGATTTENFTLPENGKIKIATIPAKTPENALAFVLGKLFALYPQELISLVKRYTKNKVEKRDLLKHILHLAKTNAAFKEQLSHFINSKKHVLKYSNADGDATQGTEEKKKWYEYLNTFLQSASTITQNLVNRGTQNAPTPDPTGTGDEGTPDADKGNSNVGTYILVGVGFLVVAVVLYKIFK